MTLPALEPTVTRLETWATERSIECRRGVLELGTAFPVVTVVGFKPDDLDLFLALAGALPPAVLVIDAPVLSDEDLRLATALTADLKGGAERSHYRQVIADASSHLGKVHDITVTAFAPGIARVVIYRAATDWGDGLFSIIDVLKAESR